MKHLNEFEKYPKRNEEIAYDQLPKSFFDPYYELMKMDRFEDAELVELEDEDGNFNPFDIYDMVELLIKYEKRGENVFLKKVTERVVDNEIIKKIKIELEAKKYNL